MPVRKIRRLPSAVAWSSIAIRSIARPRANGFRDVADRSELDPSVLRCVNADEQQQILGRDRSHGSELEFDCLRATPEEFLVGGEAERARCNFPMNVDCAHPAGTEESVLVFLKVAGRQAFAPGVRRQVSFGGKYFRDPRQVSLPHQNIQIDELAQVDRAVSHSGQHRTFESNRCNVRRLQQSRQAHELRRQMAVVERNQLRLYSQLRDCVGGHR